MMFSGVIYAQGDLALAVSQVRTVCELGCYSGWSLRGNPFAINYPPQAGVAHICILQQAITDTHDVHLDSAIGTIHLFQVVSGRVKITARPELLDGQCLPAEAEAHLRDFWRSLERRLATSGLVASSRDLGGGLNATIPLAPRDTGPLRR